MSDRLNKFIQQLEQLPDRQRAMLADYLQDHLEVVLDEARWQESFAKLGKLLRQMSMEIDDAILNGDVAQLDPDKL